MRQRAAITAIIVAAAMMGTMRLVGQMFSLGVALLILAFMIYLLVKRPKRQVLDF